MIENFIFLDRLTKIVNNQPPLQLYQIMDRYIDVFIFENRLFVVC